MKCFLCIKTKFTYIFMGGLFCKKIKNGVVKEEWTNGIQINGKNERKWKREKKIELSRIWKKLCDLREEEEEEEEEESLEKGGWGHLNLIICEVGAKVFFLPY